MIEKQLPETLTINLAERLLTELDLYKPETNSRGIDGLCIDRDDLLCDHRYARACSFIPELRKYLSSSRLTGLQSTACKQRWPLLNLVRQVLAANGFAMTPRRRSAGYDSQGRKCYKRYFAR